MTIAIDAEQIEQHHRADAGAIAAGRAMEQERVNVGLGEQPVEAPPVGDQRHHEEQMLLAFLAREEILVAFLEPHVAHRNVFPSHGLEHRVVGRTEMRDLDAALQRHQCAQTDLVCSGCSSGICARCDER